MLTEEKREILAIAKLLYRYNWKCSAEVISRIDNVQHARRMFFGLVIDPAKYNKRRKINQV